MTRLPPWHLVYEDPEPSENERIEDLEHEVGMLLSKIDALERELVNRSPTKKPKSMKTPVSLRESSLSGGLASGESNIENSLQNVTYMKVPNSYQSPSVTPKMSTSKPRKLATRKRDLGPEDTL
jgi:hypothetical protein